LRRVQAITVLGGLMDSGAGRGLVALTGLL
jgi:hypothetical protein